MKKKVLLTLGAVAAVATPVITVVSCNDNDKTSVNYRRDFTSGNAWYVDSAEKNAMTKTIYKQAESMFDILAAQDGFDNTKVNSTTFVVSNPDSNKAIPVVFMDLDETVLDNVAYQNWNLVNGNGFSVETWRNWVSIGQAKKLQGSIDFIKHVWAKGGVVMFNSDRDQDQVPQTRANLVQLGLDANQLPDWVFWMQGCDPTNAKPWTVTDHDHTKKETRMDTMNKKTAGYDLSVVAPSTAPASGNAVVLKTVMRVGDNLNDFNDLAYKHAVNADRNQALNDHIGANFGATDQHGKIYNTTSKKWEDETWNEGYVLIGGNVAYGGWEEGLKSGYYGLSAEEQSKARYDAVANSDHWDGTKTWKKK